MNVLQLHLKNQDALGVATALTYNDAGSNAKAHEKVLQERLKGSFSRSEPGKRMKENIRVALKTINDKPIIPIIK